MLHIQALLWTPVMSCVTKKPLEPPPQVVSNLPTLSKPDRLGVVRLLRDLMCTDTSNELCIQPKTS